MQIHLLNWLNNWRSVKLAPQILSIKDERIFFFNFLIIGLCNSSANSSVVKYKRRWFDIFLFLTAPVATLFSGVAEVFYQKNV